MKLIQQSKLFFKEGTSDKVYEIDLCELSSSEYIINFRYGRRGSTLKEGTKTPEAVSLEKAQTIFSSLENEKRNKGYQTEVEVFIELPNIENIKPTSREGVILQRLQDAIDKRNSFKTEWKTSRVIWKAGELKIKEAIPFIIKLATKGDIMQTYSSLYALTKLEAQQAEPLFQSFAFQQKQKPHIRHVACEGLLTILEREELNNVVFQLLKKLPYDIRVYIENNQYEELVKRLIKDSEENNVDYFTNLYLVCKVRNDLMPSLMKGMEVWGFESPHFQQIRSIYKLSQLRGDYNTMAYYAYWFERGPANYQKPFSKRTRKYFQRNSFIKLRNLGESNDSLEYLKYALSLLLQYQESDYTPIKEELYSDYGRYDYKNKLYYYTLVTRPECYDSLLLTSILFGNDPARKIDSDLKFLISQRIVSSYKYYFDRNNIYIAKDKDTFSTIRILKSPLFDNVKSLFNKEKKYDTPPPIDNIIRGNPNTPPPPPSLEEIEKVAKIFSRTELYPEHWDAMPSAYIQLLIQAKMNIIHKFAYNNLINHSDYNNIIHNFDKNTLLLLLNSIFETPNKLGFEILEYKKDDFTSDGVFISEILDSNSSEARVFAQSIINNNINYYFEDINFIAKLISNTKKENNIWINSILKQYYFDDTRKLALLGRLTSELLQYENNEINNNKAKVIIERINILFPRELHKISWDIVEELILSPLTTNIWLASNITIEKSQRIHPTEIPLSAVDLFLRSEINEVRQNGIQLLNKYSPSHLADNLNFILNQTDTYFPDVLSNTLNILKTLIRSYNTGNDTIKHLVYVLIRKEKFEKSHSSIINFINEELKSYWNSGLQPKDITKLIQCSYRESQLMGYEILKCYINTNDFTIPQIISFGNHELLIVRNWCIQYYKNNVSRIRFEKDKSLNLLDSKWDDTREQAFQFFRTNFTSNDWDISTLINIIDSVRPDVQEFGKELIKIYITQDDIIEFLQKLSEHPDVSIQSFISVYLNQYASGNIESLKKLEYYFRSILTRVNKCRVAKNRILNFLHAEALNDESAANLIIPILDEMSAQSSIQDKEKYIQILTEVIMKYPHSNMHLTII